MKNRFFRQINTTKFTVGFLLLFLLFTGNFLAKEAFADDVKSGKVIVVIIDDLDLMDLKDTRLVNFRYLREGGSVGLMNTRIQTLVQANRESAYLTIGMSTRVNLTPDQLKAVKEYRLGDIYPESQLNNLGDTARKTGQKISVIGNSDSDTAVSYASLIAMDSDGLVDSGDTGKKLTVKDPDFAWGIRTDPNRLYNACIEALKSCSILFVDFGDTTRVAEARRKLELNDIKLNRLRDNALQNADDFLGKMRLLADKEKALLMVVSPTSPRDQAFTGIRNLSPLIIYKKDKSPSTLSSNTTRRAGLVANIDIAPTIFDQLGVEPSNNNFKGEPIKFVPDKNPYTTITENFEEYANLKILRYIVHGIYVSLLMTFLGAVFMALARGNKRYKRPAGALGVMSLSLPFFCIILPAVVGTNPLYFSVALLLMVLAVGYLAYISEEEIGLLLGTLSLGTSVPIILDQYFKSGYLLMTPFGFNDVFTGGRYYGINNDLMGIFLGSAVFALFFVLDKLKPGKLGQLLLTSVVGFLVILALTPQYGANVGGTIAALAIGIISIWVLLTENPFKIRYLLIVIFLVLIGELAISYTDTFFGEKTHAGKTMLLLMSGGIFQQLLSIITTKLKVFLPMLVIPPWNIIFFIQGYFCWRIFRPKLWLANITGRRCLLLKSFEVIFWGAMFAFAFNDTGIIATALMLTYMTIPLSIILVREELVFDEYR